MDDKLFAMQDENKIRIGDLLALFRLYKPGQVVPHAEIEEAIEIPQKSDLFYRLVRIARNRLRDEDGIWSNVVTDVGVALQTPHETLTEEVPRRQRKARRQVGIAAKAVGALNVKKLTPLQRRQREAVLAAAAEQRRMLRHREIVANREPQRSARPTMATIAAKAAGPAA